MSDELNQGSRPPQMQIKPTENELYVQKGHNIKPLSSAFSAPSSEHLRQFDSIKFIYHAPEILELLNTGDLSSPITLDVDSTNSCNQHCVWCSFEYLHRNTHQYLSLDTFKRMITDFASFKKANDERGVKSIIFTGGGEPTLNRHLDSFMELCLSADIRCGLYTNGTNISSRLEEAILSSCDFVRFSLETSYQELYNLLHCPVREDDFERVSNAIVSIVEGKRRKKKMLTVGVSFLLHPSNLEDLEASVIRAKEMGVDYFQVKPVIKKAYESQDLTIDLVEEAKRLYPKMRSHATPDFKVIIIEQKIDDIVGKNYGRNYAKCLGHFLSSTISADGGMYLCTEHRGIEKYKLGNINEQGFYEIWNSNRRKEVIRTIDLSECQPGCKGHFRTLAIERIKSVEHPEFI